MDAVRPRELLLALQRVFLLVKRRAGIAEDGHGQASAPEESELGTRRILKLAGEETTLPPQRATESEAALVTRKTRLDRIPRQVPIRIRRRGIQRRTRPHQIEGLTGPLVAARFRGYVDDAVTRASVLD